MAALSRRMIFHWGGHGPLQIRALHCHHLAVTCCSADVSVFLLSELTLGGILVRMSLSVAGVLAQPIVILLKTGIGAREKYARESAGFTTESICRNR